MQIGHIFVRFFRGSRYRSHFGLVRALRLLFVVAALLQACSGSNKGSSNPEVQKLWEAKHRGEASVLLLYWDAYFGDPNFDFVDRARKKKGLEKMIATIEHVVRTLTNQCSLAVVLDDEDRRAMYSVIFVEGDRCIEGFRVYRGHARLMPIPDFISGIDDSKVLVRVARPQN